MCEGTERHGPLHDGCSRSLCRWMPDCQLWLLRLLLRLQATKDDVKVGNRFGHKLVVLQGVQARCQQGQRVAVLLWRACTRPVYGGRAAATLGLQAVAQDRLERTSFCNEGRLCCLGCAPWRKRPCAPAADSLCATPRTESRRSLSSSGRTMRVQCIKCTLLDAATSPHAL